VLPLAVQRLAGNVAALCNSVADVLPRRWHILRELHRNARHKLAYVPHVAAAAQEEEARCQSPYLRATVRAMVDLPVPASPLSQKTHRPSVPSAQLCISSRRATRVSGRQAGSCCFANALKGASSARGRRSRVLSSPARGVYLAPRFFFLTA
jgi:hypothetical protein